MKNFLNWNHVLFLTVLFIGSGFLCACTKDFNPVYDKTLKHEERVMAENAFEIFCDDCKPLMSDFREDIESIEIKKMPGKCSDYSVCADYNWSHFFQIIVKTKRDARRLPVKARDNYLYYDLGGPDNPGISIAKYPDLCGVDKPDRFNQAFIPETRLSFIKSEDSPHETEP